MSITPRSQPYQVDWSGGDGQDLATLNTRLPTLFGQVNEMFDILFTDLSALADQSAALTTTIEDAAIAPYQQVVTVAKSGGDFDTIQDAIDSITDAASTKRYLIRVMPGKYEEQITMKSWVDIRGSSKRTVQISFASSDGAIKLADWVQVEDVLLELTDTEGDWAIVGDNVSNWHIRNVDILSNATTKRGAGIKVTGSSWHTGFIEHVVINTYTQTNQGIRIESDGSDLADVTLNDVFVDSFEATTGGSVLFNNLKDTQLRDVFARTSSSGYCVRVTGTSDVTLSACWLEFGTESLEVTGGIVQVNTSAIDTWSNSGGTLRGVWENPDTGFLRLRDANATAILDGTGNSDAILEFQDAGTAKARLWYDQSFAQPVLQSLVAAGNLIIQTNAGTVIVYNGTKDVFRVLTTGTLELPEQSSSPATPATGYGRTYVKTDGWMYFKNDDGVEHRLGPATLTRKTSDESVASSTTLQADNELLFAIGASEVWEFEFEVHYVSTTSGGFRCGLKFPMSPTQVSYRIIGPAPGASGVPISGDVVSAGGFTADAVSGLALGGDTGVSVATIKGFIRNGSTAGNVVLWWAQGTSNGTDTTVKTGSYVIARRIA